MHGTTFRGSLPRPVRLAAVSADPREVTARSMTIQGTPEALTNTCIQQVVNH